MSSTTLTATADAYTNSGANAGTNYGSATDLRVGNDGTTNGAYNSFVTFNVHDLTSNLGAAFLTLHGSQTVGQTGLRVYDVTSDPAEGTVTWNNQPAADQLQSIAPVATSAADYEFDVLPYLQYAKAASIATVTFEVTQDTANGTPSGYADFSSREGSNAPKLVCYTNDMVEAPTADAYVDNTIPTGNFGSDTDLLVGSDSGEVSNALLSFDLSSVQGTPTNCYMHLWADALWGQDIGVVVKPVTSSWTESGVTWNNAPTVGSSASTVIVGDGTLREYTLDVSGLVSSALAANATHVDFELQETAVAGVTNSDYIEFNSREASGNTPSLVLSGSPTVATPASATLTSGTPGSAVLSVRGGDVAGDQNLTYTWSVTSAPDGADLTFGDNGDNSAYLAPIIFHKAGTYSFLATISDGANSVTSAVTMDVAQTTTRVEIANDGAAFFNGGGQTYSATAYDQFDDPMTTQPALTWSATSGSIDSGGNYNTSLTGAGDAQITATADSVTSDPAYVAYGAEVGNVYDDLNSDAQDEAGEDNLEGFQVYLDANGNGVQDAGEPATTSDPDGNWGLPAYGSGCQFVRLVGQSGYSITDGVKAVLSGVKSALGALATTPFLTLTADKTTAVPGQTVTLTAKIASLNGTTVQGKPVTLSLSTPSGATPSILCGKLQDDNDAGKVTRDTAADGTVTVTLKVKDAPLIGQSLAPLTVTATTAGLQPVKLDLTIHRVGIKFTDVDGHPITSLELTKLDSPIHKRDVIIQTVDADAPGTPPVSGIDISATTSNSASVTPTHATTTGANATCTLTVTGQANDSYGQLKVTLPTSSASKSGMLKLDIRG